MEGLRHRNYQFQHVELGTEVPSALKQLARLVVRGFYAVEDILIVDMLVRNPCMREDDIAEVLRFEKKQLRTRLTVLRADKFLQSRLKMETGPNAKVRKVNYFYINYKIFVNVVKYKLDLMRKRMETQERDATSRASFKCEHCFKSFTDLEADQLFDFNTQEFRCTFCGYKVEEDGAALSKKDSRLMLAKFNEQIKPLIDLLRTVEGIQLSPEILEPEPIDIESIRGRLDKSRNLLPRTDVGAGQWLGEAIRKQGFHVEETCVNIKFGDEEVNTDVKKPRDRPIWMTESTIYAPDNVEAILQGAAKKATGTVEEAAKVNSKDNNILPTFLNNNVNYNRKKDNEDVMIMLLANEKNLERKNKFQDADSSDSDTDFETVRAPGKQAQPQQQQINSSIDNDDMMIISDAPAILISGSARSIDQLSDYTLKNLTPQEQDAFINTYQSHYSHLFE